MKPTRISASSRFYTNYPGGVFSPVEMIRYFHAVGFHAVDFDIETVPAMGDDWKRILTEMAEEAAKCDVSLEMGHLPFHSVLREDGTKDREAFHRNMLHCIEAAGYIGIKHAVIHPKGDQRDSRENYDRELARNIEYMTPYVEQAERFVVAYIFYALNYIRPILTQSLAFADKVDELLVYRLKVGAIYAIAFDIGHSGRCRGC